MVGYKKLAIVAAGLLAGLAAEVQAAPFTDSVFVTYNSTARGGRFWSRGSGIFIHFVVWRDSNPEFNVDNISWAERWTGEGGSLQPPPNPDPRPEFADDRIPPWRRPPIPIPEPSTALLAGLGVAGAALRRRKA